MDMPIIRQKDNTEKLDGVNMKATEERIEYYDVCPNCGARSKVQDTCEYCGSSLIKSVIRSERNIPVVDYEEELRAEDAKYPILPCRSCGRNTFLNLFCGIFGGCFILVPFIVGTAFIGAGIAEMWVIAMLGLFLLVGVGSLVPLIINISNTVKCKSGDLISAKVRGYENTMSSINGQPVLAVRLLINKDGRPGIIVLNTGKTTRSYSINQEIEIRNRDNLYMLKG